MAREFIMPGRIISGIKALNMAEAALGRMGKKAMIVTDPMMVKLGNCAKVEEALKNEGVAYTVYDGVTGEPTDQMVEAGVAKYRSEGCDFLVALGGGSPIDTMKAIGSLVLNDVGIASYMGKEIHVQMPPMAAVPTTAGTGSEATQFTIITDTVKDVKMLLKGSVLMPDLAIIDPQFTMTAPPKITAATGLDALCHGLEAYTSRKSQRMSDTFALSAVKRIFRNLAKAYHNGEDEDARSEMSLAALEAGIAFNNASVTLIHGMSRPIGALFHVPHGLSNAMLMKVCLEYALEGAYDRFGALGRAIGVAGRQDSDETAARNFLQAVEALLQELEVPSLEQYGIDRDTFFAQIDKMAHDAMESGSPQNTRRAVEKAEVEELYRRLWN